MRLLKIGVYYKTYLEQFYERRPGLAAGSYDAQHAALIEDCFGSSDFWTCELSRIGYETCDLIINAEPLQKAWAAERGLMFDEEDWPFGITEAQVRTFRPDVLIVADYSTVTAAFIRHLRDVCPSIRLVLGWCGAPYSDGSVFHEWDVVLSCVPELVTHFRESGHRSRHVNHAFEPRVLEKLDEREKAPTTEFVFIGSLVKSEHFHLEREKLLSRLVAETDLQIWSEVGPPPSRLRNAARLLLRGSAATAPQFSFDARIARRARPPLFGLDMFRQLRARPRGA